MTDTPPPIREFAAPGVRPPDPDLDDGEATPTTALAELRSELQAAPEFPDVALDVPGRPGYAVRYSTHIAHEQLTAWQKKAKDKSSPTGVNDLKWLSVLLATQCEAIVRNGVDVELGGADGEPATFRSPAFQELLGVDRAVSAVQVFYARDASVLAAGVAVLQEAGYGDEAETVDPTSA